MSHRVRRWHGWGQALTLCWSNSVKQVFPTFDVLGWYSIGDEPTPEDLALHKQFIEYNETPLFMQLSRKAVTKDLPVTIYETNVEIVNNEPVTVWVKASYEIETGEAERVAVDHASKSTTSHMGSQSSRSSFPFNF